MTERDKVVNQGKASPENGRTDCEKARHCFHGCSPAKRWRDWHACNSLFMLRKTPGVQSGCEGRIQLTNRDLFFWRKYNGSPSETHLRTRNRETVVSPGCPTEPAFGPDLRRTSLWVVKDLAGKLPASALAGQNENLRANWIFRALVATSVSLPALGLSPPCEFPKIVVPCIDGSLKFV